MGCIKILYSEEGMIDTLFNESGMVDTLYSTCEECECRNRDLCDPMSRSLLSLSAHL